MEKYIKPSVEIEKFTVADVITDSTGSDKPVDNNTGSFGDITGNSVGLEINDEF